MKKTRQDLEIENAELRGENRALREQLDQMRERETIREMQMAAPQNIWALQPNMQIAAQPHPIQGDVTGNITWTAATTTTIPTQHITTTPGGSNLRFG